MATELRVGTVVNLEFDRPPDGCSWRDNYLTTLE